MSNQLPVYDVIVVGAGLSGIGAAYHLQHECPEKTFVVLESRDTMGGTWDLFKYRAYAQTVICLRLAFLSARGKIRKPLPMVLPYFNTSKIRLPNSVSIKDSLQP